MSGVQTVRDSEAMRSRTAVACGLICLKIVIRVTYPEDSTFLNLTFKSNRVQWAQKDEMNRFIIEHLGLLRLVVVIVSGTLKTGDLKNDIPDPAHKLVPRYPQVIALPG